MNTTDTTRVARKATVCRILGCGSTYIYNLTQKGELTPIRLSRRMTVYDLAEVHALVDKRVAEARAASTKATECEPAAAKAV